MKDKDQQLIWEAYLAEDQEGSHYTFVSIGGNHGENQILLKSFGHVPDEKVPAMIDYYMTHELIQSNDWEHGQYEDFSKYEHPSYDISHWSPEEQELFKKPGYNFMSTMYDDIGIPVANGEYHVADQYKMVKHPKPPETLIDGTNNFGGKSRSWDEIEKSFEDTE